MMVVEAYSAEMVRLILSMTFTGSILSGLLFILKPVIKEKLSETFQYYMWFPVVTALLVPVSKIMVIPVSGHSEMAVRTTGDLARWIADTASAVSVNPVLTAQNESGQTIRQIACFPSVAVMLFAIWQTGMLMVLGLHLICYLIYVRRLARHNIRADRQEVELLQNLSEGDKGLRLYRNTMVETPVLIGFFRPAVILPDKAYGDVKLRHILLHEMTHRKRQDIFVKWLLIFAGAVHWFNPLVYFVRQEMNKACELACDESVIKRFDISEMQQYGDTLIAVAADSIRKMPLSITMFENKRNLKERLDAIMKHKKHSKRTVIVASSFLVTIVCAILGFSTLQGIENGYSYADNYPLPQDQKHIKEIELKNILCNYDKKSIAEAYAFLSDSDGEITNAYITIICQGKTPDFEMQSGIKSLASEELELDVQNIYVDYVDFESFISNQTETDGLYVTSCHGNGIRKMSDSKGLLH